MKPLVFSNLHGSYWTLITRHHDHDIYVLTTINDDVYKKHEFVVQHVDGSKEFRTENLITAINKLNKLVRDAGYE